MPHELDKVYGKHAVRAVLLRRPKAVTKILIADGGARRQKRYAPVTEEYLRLVEAAPVKAQIVPWNEFFRLTGLNRDDGHQGICIFTRPKRIYSENDLGDLAPKRLVIALDQLSNPRNLGTILRSAAYFRVDGVILMQYRSAQITPEVVQISSGATEFLKIYRVTNLARALEDMKRFDYWIYGLEERGSAVLAETEFDRKTVLVVGAEGQGMRQKTTKCCDCLVRIPGSREGLESLNAGVAASIALADVSSRPFFRKQDANEQA